MSTDSMGRFSGRAYVEFSSQEEADKALQRNQQLIGHRWASAGANGPLKGEGPLIWTSCRLCRYIEVFPSSRSSIRSSFRKRPSRLPPPEETSSRAGPDPQSESRRGEKL